MSLLEPGPAPLTLWPRLRPTFRYWMQTEVHVYGPFTYSVTIVLWSFLGAMIVLAGAEWAARRSLLEQTPPAESGLPGHLRGGGASPYTDGLP